MSSTIQPVSRNSVPACPAELRRDIEEVRGDMAETVNALAHKLDVKGRAQDKAQEIKAQVTEKVREVRAQAPEKVQQLAEKTQQLAGSAQQKAQQVAQQKPVAPMGAALTALVLLILLRRRRLRRQ